MSTELTDEDARKLFNEVSQSIRNNEVTRLDELIEATPAQGNPEEITSETPAEPVQAQPETIETPEEPSTPPDGTQEDTPPTQPETAENNTGSNTTQTPDELATLKEELNKLKTENHHLKSQAGRMPSMQSQIRKLDKKLEELRSQLSSPSSRPSAKLKPELEKLLAKIRETDQELADTWEQSLLSTSDLLARETLTAEIARTEQLRNEEYDAYCKAQWNTLVETVPNAPDIFKSKGWTEWKSKQSRAVQELASSDTAEDVIFAIKKYAEDMIAQYPELASTVKEEEAPAASTAPVVNEEAQKIEAARRQRKTTSVVAESPVPAGQVSTPSDPQSLFKLYSEQIRKERLGTT